MTTDKLKLKALNDFKTNYPATTSADWQTFVLGMNAGITITATFNKEYSIRAYNLLKDATNPNNSFGIAMAIDELFHLIEHDKMNTLEDYIAFKNEWYSQLKNKSF